MKKILLVGKIGEVVSGINACLTEEFQIQLCAPVAADVKGMVKIVKPDLIILSQEADALIQQDVYRILDEYWSHIPVLVMCTKETWRMCGGFGEGSQYDKLFRPVAKADLLYKCRAMLNMYDSMNASRKKILVVDDSAMVLRNIKGMLEEKYDIILATSGEKAIKIVEEREVDMIFLDYEMPGMDGRETFEAILKTDNGAITPVVFLTSVSDRTRIVNVLKNHPTGYVLKPPDKDKILAIIREVLGE